MTSFPDGGVATWVLPDLDRSQVATVIQPVPEIDPREVAWAEGERAGRQAALAELEAERRGAHDSAELAARALDAAAAKLHEAVRRTVPAYALAIARHVIEQAYEADPALLQTLVQRALELYPFRGPITLRLHPADLAALQAIGGTVLPVREVDVRWSGDPELMRGSLCVDADTMILDGRVDRVLLDLYDQLSRD